MQKSKLYQAAQTNRPLLLKVGLALIIFLMAIATRAHLAATGRIEYDEKDYAKAAVLYANDLQNGDWRAIIHEDFNYEHPTFNKLVYALALLPDAPRQPFDLSMHFSVSKVKPQVEVIAMRWVSVIFGSLTVLFLALANPLAGLFLALHTFAIKYTSVIYLEALPLLAALIALQAFVRFQKCGAGKTRAGWLALSAVALGIAAASKYMYAVIGIVIVLYSGNCMIRSRRPALHWLAMWGVLSLLVFWAADPYLWADPAQRLADSIRFNIEFSQGPAVKYTAYPTWQPVLWLWKSIPQQTYRFDPFFLQPEDFWITIDTWIFVLAVIGLPLTAKRAPEYFLWLVAGMAFLLLWSTKWPQYVLFVLPPLCVTAAYGVQTPFWLWKKRTWSRSIIEEKH